MENSKSSGFIPDIWHGTDGKPLSCRDKIKVLNENLEEIREQCQDALEDAVLMGCEESQLRDTLRALIDSLDNQYKKA